jgi:hypothetical protein
MLRPAQVHRMLNLAGFKMLCASGGRCICKYSPRSKRMQGSKIVASSRCADLVSRCAEQTVQTVLCKMEACARTPAEGSATARNIASV